MALRRTLLCSVLLTLFVVPAPSPAAAAATTGFRPVDVVAADGVVLKGNVISPSAPGSHPAIVFISSWGLNDAEYLAQAGALAEAGYVVLSYTARGFWGSGGEIGTAGPADVADVSAALDWLVAHTAADPDRLGVAGVSYGAGIGLIAAGQDRRIRAVAALSGWTDLVASLYGDATRRPQAVWLLKAAAELTGRPSAEFDEMVADYFANRDVDQVTAWARARGAASYLAAINASSPAVLLANAYGDSLFPPNQLVDFFGRLAGPKRLELAPGDHAVVEAGGLIGLPNHVWTSVRRWFDQYLSGRDTGIAGEPPVVLRVPGSGAVESYPAWAQVAGEVTRYDLGWSQTIRTNVDTVADGGVVLLSNGLAALTGVPPTAWLPAVDRRYGAIWTSDRLPATVPVRGIVRLHLGVRPSAPAGTLVAYLYDVDAVGVGRLVTHAPVSWSAPTAALDVALPATAWNVPAGHRLALVVDTVDPLYISESPAGATVALTGPSWADVPTRS